ncbi:hypothetical protein DAPPUDRAFT_235768 [Daphnia pulex]|uniref:Uncharacterized protein n=1 Tax=Daphnia pulex TaxID=6669 RepID=E9G0T0_DAPPU|nr:hypothetical protein DAPPUDRAFT_235768 [Daphnia pulex]|eukprot:EFX87350.1 hypothetical protein DAPPUDRAFT_235768 [Daphnia pulex]
MVKPEMETVNHPCCWLFGVSLMVESSTGVPVSPGCGRYPTATLLSYYATNIRKQFLHLKGLYYTDEFKYYSSPSKYQTEGPVYYTTIALECYNTTCAAPNYDTVAPKCYTSMHNQFAIVYFDVVLLLEYYTTKAAEYYTTKAAEYYTTKAAEYYTTSYAATTFYIEAPKFYS